MRPRELGRACFRERLGLGAWTPAKRPAVRESHAAYLAELVAPCGTVTAELIDEFQAHPERALTPPGAAGSAVRHGTRRGTSTLRSAVGAPGVVPAALGVISGQRTRAGSLRWDNEPDLYDALRSTLKARTPPSTHRRFLDRVRHCAALHGLARRRRPFPGDGLCRERGADSFRLERAVRFAAAPLVARTAHRSDRRHVHLDRPRRRAPQDASRVSQSNGKRRCRFGGRSCGSRADGTETSRVLVTAQQKATSAEKNLDALDGLSGVAVVGVNVGDLALDDPFDPDHAPYEPHSYVLTVAAEAP